MKAIIARIHELFNSMQRWRDVDYIYFLNMEGTNLTKHHAFATEVYLEGMLSRRSRSSLLDKIAIEEAVSKSGEMELAVAKLRFDVELDAVEEAERRGQKNEADLKLAQAERQKWEEASLRSGRSSSASISLSTRCASPSAGTSFGTLSTKPTVLSDSAVFDSRSRSAIRASPVIVRLDGPDSRSVSPAVSARSAGHVHSRDTWRTLQGARARLGRRGILLKKGEGVSEPGSGQKLDHFGRFMSRPDAAN